jgi:protein gp37
MGANTSIAWCDHTFNPWWGCQKVSEECRHCYAEAFARRVGHAVWGSPQTTRRRFFGAAHWELDAERARLWSLIEATAGLDWLLLTKRPESILEMVPSYWRAAWPEHVWVGTTVGHLDSVDRVAALRRVPARIRFLSVEPLLTPLPGLPLDGIHWIIIGGESGPGARPMDLAWMRSVRDEARAARARVFIKQLGSRPMLDGQRLRLRDRKGEDPAEWPDDLRVQEFPA